MNKPILVVSMLTMSSLLGGCDPGKPQATASAASAPAESSAASSAAPAPAPPAAASPAPTVTAVAALKPASGSQVSGTVSFAETHGGVHIVADVNGLTPGEHGFHVHEKGDCSAADASSAGGHFNPGGTQHGSPNAAPHHAGDLGNLDADASGHATLDTVVAGLSLTGPNSILGKGLVVHGGKDDLKSQPAGNSGPRVACGVIEASGAPAVT